MHRAVRSTMRVAAVAAALAGLVLAASCATGGDSGDAGGQPEATTGHGHASFSPPPAAPLRAGERFLNVSMPQSYEPAAPNGGTDEYRCFLVDPGLARDTALTGSQFLPDNVALVHHAIFFRVSPEDVKRARDVDAKTPGAGWTCFGDAGIGGDQAWVASWAPGANETLLDADVGYLMPAGSQLVMQIHYNLLAAEGAPDGADRSGIRLRVTDDVADIRPLETGLLPAPVELPCAPGESGALCDRSAAIADVGKRFGEEVGSSAVRLNEWCNAGRAPVAGTTQRCDHEVAQAGTVYALGGHMHLLGRSIKIELNPGSPRARMLLDMPQYNFDDQAVRPLAEPITVKPGDTYRVTCTHDATLRAKLPQLQKQPPRYVVWGDGTSDEMCLGLVVWSPADKDR